MRLNKLLALALTAFSAVWGVQSIRAAQIPWVHPNGSTATFDYTNGGTSDQLFVPAGTDPVVTPTGLAFFPSAFKAQASGGNSQQTSDKLSFDIHVHQGQQLSGFAVNELGDYTIQGSGPNTAVKVFGSLFLTNLDDTTQIQFDTLHTTPAAIGVGNGVTSGQGAWSGSENLLTIPAGWTNIRVVLDNTLQVGSDPGTNSFIEKKVVTPGVTINLIIPEPASAGLALASVGMLLARRRRSIV